MADLRGRRNSQIKNYGTTFAIQPRPPLKSLHYFFWNGSKFIKNHEISCQSGELGLAARPEKRNVGGIEHRSGYALPALDAPNIKWPGFAPPNGRLLIRR